MNFDLVRDVLWSWAKGKVEALEVFAFEKGGLKIEKKDGRLENFQPFREEGLAVRVLANQAFGFSYTTEFSPEALIETAERALEMTAVVEPEPQLTLPTASDWPRLSLPETPLLSSEEALNRLERLEKAAFSYDSRVKRLQEASLRDVSGHLFLANTQGLHLSWSLRAHTLIAVAVAEEKEAQMGWEWRSAVSPDLLSPEEIGQEAARRAVARLAARTLPSSRVKVLLPPHVAVDFLELVSEALCGDRVLKGKSPLVGRVGEEVFSPLVTIRDHGLLENGLETRPFDDEGVPQREKTLVREGQLMGFLFDHYWGAKSGQGSTGNARRGSFKAPPGVSPTNFFLVPGETSPEKMREGRIFEVLEVLGMHTANPVSGDFSVGVAGLYYEGGEPQPVAGMALSGNVFELFRRLEAVGKDLVFYGGLGSPSLLVAEMDLSGG